MAKVDIDLVVHVAQQKLNPTSNELNAFLQELNERAEAAKPKREPACKKKLVFVPMPISAALNTPTLIRPRAAAGCCKCPRMTSARICLSA